LEQDPRQTSDSTGLSDGQNKDISPEMAKLRKLRSRLVLGFLIFFGVLLLVLISLSLILPSTEKLKGAPPSSDSAKKMYDIGYYLVLYAVRNGERLPNKLSELHKRGFIETLEAFDSNELPGKVSSDDDIDNGVDFKYLIAGKNMKISGEKVAVLAENKEDGITMFISKKEISFDFKRKDNP